MLLIPARTDTQWFHRWVYHKAELTFIEGRIKYGGSKWNAPFPSMIAVYDVTKVKGEIKMKSRRNIAEALDCYRMRACKSQPCDTPCAYRCEVGTLAEGFSEEVQEAGGYCAFNHILFDAVKELREGEKDGEWIAYPACLQYEGAYSSDHLVCSRCEHVWSVIDNDTETWNYCPNCGALMVHPEKGGAVPQ